MFDIAICNNNVNELEHMDYLLEVYRLAHPWPVIKIRRFQSLYDLVDCIRAGRTFPLYLLGHSSELWMNGHSPEAVLRREEPKGEIIAFTSTRPTSLQVSPIDPLRLAASLARPVDDQALFHVLDRVIEKSLSKDLSLQPCLPFPTPDKTLNLPFSKLSHILYDAHIVTCYMADGGALRSSTLRKPFYQLIRPLLLERRFCQVSTAWVVNMDLVDKVTPQPRREVWMADGARIPVPANAISGVIEEYNGYITLPGKRRIAPVGKKAP